MKHLLWASAKQILCLLILCLPGFTKGQGDSAYKGIDWANVLSWEQVKQKAKQENKFIFVDASTTWCMPCKWMDKEIFSKGLVGDYLNSRFISVKIQMDTTNIDNEYVKAWYRDALLIRQKYNILSYPSYLFFSSDGKIVHRGTGAMGDQDFVKLASEGLDVSTQYYLLLEKFKKGELNNDQMAVIARKAREFGETELANNIARDYIYMHLFKLSDQDLYTKKNIEFISSFRSALKSKSRGFVMFYNNANKVDEIIGQDGFSQLIVDYVISKEEIHEKLVGDNLIVDKEPSWNKFNHFISKKYGKKNAERIIINNQLEWYRYKEDWKNLAIYNVKKIEKYGLDTTDNGKRVLNNMIWEVIFLHCDEKQILEKSIKWMETVISSGKPDPVLLDTYANLLFKIGRRNEAIQWEEKAEKVDAENAAKRRVPPSKEYYEVLLKMKKGERTW